MHAGRELPVVTMGREKFVMNWVIQEGRTERLEKIRRIRELEKGKGNNR
jgi:hypothetical protein